MNEMVNNGKKPKPKWTQCLSQILKWWIIITIIKISLTMRFNANKKLLSKMKSLINPSFKDNKKINLNKEHSLRKKKKNKLITIIMEKKEQEKER